jgi:predicted ferric reductase
MKLTKNFNKTGALLFPLTVIAPCCILFFLIVLFALGHGTTEFFGGWGAYIFEGLVVISLVGFFFAYRKHKNIIPLVVGLESGGLIVYVYNFNSVIDFEAMTVGMLGLLFTTGMNYYINRRYKMDSKTWTEMEERKIELQSTITCPKCGYSKKETMPTDACQFFYECESCKTVLRPMQGDCCVYCSYGTVKCPSKQTGEECC